jgi:hypothetical protein
MDAGMDSLPSFETRASFDKLMSALLRMRPKIVAIGGHL